MHPTSSIRRRVVATVALFVTAHALAIGTAAHAQSCPGVTYSGGYYPQPVSGTSGAVSGNVPAIGSASQYQIAWNHAAGTVSVGCSGAGCSESGGFGGDASVRSMDEFVLVGPPAPAFAITIRAQAHVALASGTALVPGQFGPVPVCVTGYEARVRLATAVDSTDLFVTQTPCPPPSANGLLTLSLSVVPGVPFRVTLRASASSGCAGGGNADATLSFANVPPGYTLQSCSGFTGAVTVPARVTTWGRLKTHHR